MPVDLDLLRSIYDVHNSAGADFPDLFARDYLHPDVEFVETPAAPGATTHRGSDAVAALFRDRFEVGAMHIEDPTLTPLDERRVLATFLIRMHGKGSGAEASMRLWNLLTLDGSRITRIEEFSDEPAALAAAGPRSSPDS
jgi:hypothetical protein